MPKKISHIGIAVASIEEATPFYRDVLGMEFEGTEVVAEQKVKVAFFLPLARVVSSCSSRPARTPPSPRRSVRSTN